MNVKHTYTLSEYLDQLPIVNGQLIIIKDKDEMYYDIDDTRHRVGPGGLSSLVTLDTEQTITGAKTFEGATHIDTLTQGTGCTASAGSHAEGQNSQVSYNNTYAHAEGNGTIASGNFSHSEGDETIAEGIGSHSQGKSTLATGDYSLASGVGTTSSGRGSAAYGAGTIAGNDYSFVLGTNNQPTEGDIFEIGNGQMFDSTGAELPEENQTSQNAFRVTSEGVAVVQTDVELESGIKLSDREGVANKVTSITDSATNTQYPSALAVKDAIDSAIDELPEPMVYKGTVGTGGTVTGLPTATESNRGFTFKVITAGSYAGQAAKVGDTFISTGSGWDLIPSGDEPSGTVTNVAATGSNGIQVTGGPVTSSGTLQITGLAATQSAAGMMSADDKKKLDGIAAGANAYTLPTASSTLGGVKTTSTITSIDGLTACPIISGVPYYKDTNTTYTHPTTPGNKHIPSGGSSGQILRWSADGTAVWGEDNNTTYSNFVKSGSGAASGLVPAPPTTAGTTKYLREDGTWQAPPNTTYSIATQSADGLMSSADKTKLDNLSTSPILTDDTTGTKYTLGVNNGVLYIKEVTS